MEFIGENYQKKNLYITHFKLALSAGCCLNALNEPKKTKN
jgi:hypothetical protein